MKEPEERPSGQRGDSVPGARGASSEATAADEAGSSSTRAPTFDAENGLARGLPREGAGSRIGPYKLLRPLGEGGFGEVWEAEQREPVRRQVALKILKRGMETARVVGRFEAERQALARMDHPGIARVFDAGSTDSGRPYFVMELVKGVPITEYCDRHRLDRRQRLELFVEVCHAVQHAHMKGVIHRDLKPSNVLVELRDGRPMPKVIDFGIAKAISGTLTDRTVVTQMHGFLGTPDYMSPEQAEVSGLDVDTRSDVYSLGVLLYELLTGVTPFQFDRSGGYSEIQRVLREEDPPTPSSRVTALSRERPGGSGDPPKRAPHRDVARLRHELRGDLDWIAMKALEKDRTRRYETANALAQDVVRHLGDEPVSAGPPDLGYRLGKWIRRHRVAFAAGSLVTLALLLGVAGTGWGLWRAAAEAREARRQTEVAEAVNAFLNQDLLAAAAPSAERGRGRDVTVREVLEVAGDRLDESAAAEGRFADKPEIEYALRMTLGNTWIGLGDYDRAEAQLLRARELAASVWGERSEQSAWALGRLGWLRSRQGRFDESVAFYEPALEVAREVLGPRHQTTLQYEMELAIVYRWLGRYREAEEGYRRALVAHREVLGAEHLDTLAVLGNLANLLQETGRCEEARQVRSEQVEISRRVHGELAPITVASLNNLANDLACLGEIDEAAPLMARVLELKREIYGPDHPTTLNSLSNLGEAEAILGNFEASARLHREALDRRLRVLDDRHPRTLYSMERVALALVTLGRNPEAEELASAATAACVETLGALHPDCVRTQTTRAEALIGLGRAPEARRLLEAELERVEERRASGEDVGEYSDLLPAARFQLGRALAALGEHDEAERLLVGSAEALPAHEARTRRAWESLAEFLRERAEVEGAAGFAERAREWQQRAERWPEAP